MRSQKSGVRSQNCSRSKRRASFFCLLTPDFCFLTSVFCFLAIMTATPTVQAESIASKNKEGNRLFELGKYQDAEKAYLDAQAQSPGRPELIYNMGNSLVRQKKYEQALQSLRQAARKGDQKVRQGSSYNIGNALFEMGNFKDAVQAYVDALRVNPADLDAKHNLELALKNLKQQ